MWGPVIFAESAGEEHVAGGKGRQIRMLEKLRNLGVDLTTRGASALGFDGLGLKFRLGHPIPRWLGVLLNLSEPRFFHLNNVDNG